MSNSSGSKPADPGWHKYVQQFGIIVLCKDEAHQKRLYRKFVRQGHSCKVVVT